MNNAKNEAGMVEKITVKTILSPYVKIGTVVAYWYKYNETDE